MPGQSLSEYAIVIGLVALLGIAAVTMLGTSIQDGLANINGGNAAPSTAVVSNAPPGGTTSPSGGSSGSTSGLSSMLPPPGPGQQQVCFQSGTCVNIPVVDSTTLTAGANGGQLTHQFADVLSQIALQLQADPNADPQVSTLVTRIANAGHTMGNTEASFIQSYECCASTNYTSNLSGLSDSIEHTQADFNLNHQLLSDYLSSNPNSLPPELQSMIALEVGQINQLAVNGFLDASVISGALPPNSQAVTLTHQDSNTICNSGGDTSVCVSP
jgi:hypothetical protein